jgi:hypothetical protein
MDVLQQSLEQAMRELPALALEKLISKKLREQGIAATRSLSGRLARHILDGNEKPYRHRGRTLHGKVTLTLDEADGEELKKFLALFCKEDLPALIPSTARRISKGILKDLKSRWMTEEGVQNAELLEFRSRLEARWGKPLGQMRMLLTMIREWCQVAFNREEARKPHKKKQLRDILIRLLVRACQVTDEIICLLENGFADGAMARWRTLHEIAVVAAVISKYGEGIAELYIAHQAIESHRAMNKFASCCVQLGYRPLTTRQIKKITKAYAAAIAKYGETFKSDYGWAACHLKKKRLTFADLEAMAGRADMRAHYQMGNDNVHAGVKSMFIRLGLLGDYSGLLSGRSNGGLMEPGQNAAHTLTQLAALICLAEPNFDDLVVANMIRDLRDEIPRSFYQADKQLRRDDKHFRTLAREHDSKG